jgi:hypothetical protein
MPDTLTRLWAAADAIAAERGQDARWMFIDLGLALQRPLKRWDYFCTPHNSLTLASTGGDGVHFGLLQIGETPSGRQPIVMTVPMNLVHNFILAESLDEFLGLGYHHGWFALDQVAYQPSRVEERFGEEEDPERWPEDAGVLARLRRLAGFTPVRLSMTRIAELQAKYGPYVVADDAPPEGP